MRTNVISLRFRFLLLATVLSIYVPLLGQERKEQSNPGAPCGDQSKGLPDFYREAVLAHVEPPGWKSSLIRISVGEEIKLALWTDGENFKVWTNTFEMNERNVGKFLLQLDQSCRLPADPSDAAAQLRVKWESRDLSQAQFAHLHENLMNALSKYMASSQSKYTEIMKTKLSAVYLDARLFPVTYDNGYAHVVARVVDDPKENKLMLDWIHELEKVAENSFHRAIWKHNGTD